VPGLLLALLLGAALAGQTAGPPQRRALLDVAPRVPAGLAAPGDRFSVALDLTPAPGIHVYAPEVTGYKPIALTVKPQPGVFVRGVTYPTAESYYYAPLKETVPVYQKPFSIVQELTLDGSPSARAALKGLKAVTVQGTLSYQACDDRICYPPRHVPVSWQVPIKES
jgi:DsbC/DsbD-like thiol-disulfide interchange protein